MDRKFLLLVWKSICICWCWCVICNWKILKKFLFCGGLILVSLVLRLTCCIKLAGICLVSVKSILIMWKLKRVIWWVKKEWVFLMWCIILRWSVWLMLCVVLVLLNVFLKMLFVMLINVLFLVSLLVIIRWFRKNWCWWWLRLIICVIWCWKWYGKLISISYCVLVWCW